MMSAIIFLVMLFAVVSLLFFVAVKINNARLDAEELTYSGK